MRDRKVVVYYSWSRPGETGAPLGVIDNRFPALFESRRMLYPRFEELADPARFDQGVAGFLDHIMKANFVAFIDQAKAAGRPVAEIERVADDGAFTPLDGESLDGADTLIVIGFDSIRSGQKASDGEAAALRAFLARPGHLGFICPHHDIGEAGDLSRDERLALQTAAFLHHGDRTIPPQQQFGGLARSLLVGLGVPVENRHGLRPRADEDGSPALIEVEPGADPRSASRSPRAQPASAPAAFRTSRRRDRKDGDPRPAADRSRRSSPSVHKSRQIDLRRRAAIATGRIRR
jgi:hypothetical protein